MGNLTTITIHNDYADEIRQNPGELARKLMSHLNSGRAGKFSVGHSPGNFVKVHQSRHVSDNTFYVHMGVQYLKCLHILKKQDI